MLRGVSRNGRKGGKGRNEGGFFIEIGLIKQGNGLLYLSGYFFTRFTQAGENKD